jgi:S1-C subfamily serine protease
VTPERKPRSQVGRLLLVGALLLSAGWIVRMTRPAPSKDAQPDHWSWVQDRADAGGLFPQAGSTSASLGKDNALLRRAVAELTQEAAAATVPLVSLDTRGEQTDLALSTSIGNGRVLTKASVLAGGDRFGAIIASEDGTQTVPARTLAVDVEHDLALVELELPRGVTLPTVVFERGEALPTAGSWLITAAPDPDGPDVGDTPSPEAIGHLSVGNVRPVAGTGLQLGIQMDDLASGSLPIARVRPGGAAERAGLRPGDRILALEGQRVETRESFGRQLRMVGGNEMVRLTIARGRMVRDVTALLRNGRLGLTLGPTTRGTTVNQVFPNSPAEQAGLRRGDVITAVGETRVDRGVELVEALQSIPAGNRIELTVIRRGRERQVDVQVGDFGRAEDPRARAQNSLGGSTLSRRASDFPAILQHDTVVPANRMGGPVLDLHGRIVGLNIARAGRVETYALPASVIREVLPKLESRAATPRQEASPADALTADGVPEPQKPLAADG